MCRVKGTHSTELSKTRKATWSERGVSSSHRYLLRELRLQHRHRGLTSPGLRPPKDGDGKVEEDDHEPMLIGRRRQPIVADVVQDKIRNARQVAELSDQRVVM